MHRLLLLTLLIAAARGAAVDPPGLVRDDDTTSLAPPDLATDSPDVSSSAAPSSDTSAPVTDTSAPDVTTNAVTSALPETSMAMTSQGPDEVCNPSLDKIQAVYNYSNTDNFKDLSENQQILVYELLAAGENCKLKDFITAETAQRIFLLAEDLPLKYVYLFISFLARNMEAEGVLVPV